MTADTWSPLPDPPAPPDLAVRHLPWRRHDVREGRDGDLALLSAEAFRAEIIARDAAWSQVPAGSLPDDDRILAHLLGFGRDTRRLRRARDAGALHGWLRCSDGRLWNLHLVSEAQEALENVEANRERTKKARAKAAELRRASTDEVPVSRSVTERVAENREKRGWDERGREGTNEKRHELLGSGGVEPKPFSESMFAGDGLNEFRERLLSQRSNGKAAQAGET